ncbi:MAG: DHH family phosphoesterase [Abitibacteriaceae bacterium]|nr:DHH family phosphoesterase [Abditibacteriaceae bacterium]
MVSVPESIPNPTPNLDAARGAFTAWVQQLPKNVNIVCLHDSDADGVTAGVVWQRALERLGFTSLQRVIPDRERNAWRPGNRARVAAANPHKLFVLDLGSQPVPVIEGITTCFVDHHRPEGVPPGDTLISAYSWEPIPNTSLLIYNLCQPLVDIADLDWIAAIGTFSDLGEHAPFDLLPIVKKKYTAKYLKEATTLINAARRASHYDPETAAQALLTHNSPRELVESTSPQVEQLRAARAEVKVALEEAKKAAPVFAGQAALIRINTPCQIHPLIAQIWRTRLPKYIVFAANEGYMPGRVNFSTRAAPGVNVLDFLQSINLSEGEGNFGHGHDQASGGSLPVARWNELLTKLGFDKNVFVQE